mgnify:CR=1 FL=1
MALTRANIAHCKQRKRPNYTRFECVIPAGQRTGRIVGLPAQQIAKMHATCCETALRCGTLSGLFDDGVWSTNQTQNRN